MRRIYPVLAFSLAVLVAGCDQSPTPTPTPAENSGTVECVTTEDDSMVMLGNDNAPACDKFDHPREKGNPIP